jgi:hypothetical protein
MLEMEELRQAVVAEDYQRVKTLLAKLPAVPESIGEAAGIRDLLVWALQVARVRRAHDAARLVELIRSTAYLPRDSNSCSTWKFDG